VSTTPLLSCLPLRLAVAPLPLALEPLRLALERLRVAPERLRLLAFPRLCELRFALLPPEPDDPLLDRVAALRLRLDAADFDREEPLEPLDVVPLLALLLLLLLLLLLREAGLPVAMQISPHLGNPFQDEYPSVYAVIAL
jgi:hypothetical protein